MIQAPGKARGCLPPDVQIDERCARCRSSQCCRQITIEIETPLAKTDFEDLLWFLAHRGVSIFVDEGSWYLSVETDCEFLDASGMCGIYEIRPAICSEYSSASCDRDEDTEFELQFVSYEELFAYLQARFPAFQPEQRGPLDFALGYPGGSAEPPVWLRRKGGKGGRPQVR